MTAPPPPPNARSSPSAIRNRDPILEVLRAHLPATGRVLEVAAGSGEHALHISTALPGLTWTPTDPSPEARASIAAWREAMGPPNLTAPVELDAARPETWPAGPFDAVININMVHISPWAAAEGLMAGAGAILRPGGLLFLYGPFLEAEVETAPSNLAFDQDLRTRNPAWGLRRRNDIATLALQQGLAFSARVEMPSNNLALIFIAQSPGKTRP